MILLITLTMFVLGGALLGLAHSVYESERGNWDPKYWHWSAFYSLVGGILFMLGILGSVAVISGSSG